LNLDRDLFRHAYQMGREHHFETCQEEPSQARIMTVEQVMGLVAVPNVHGDYEFDDAPTKAEEIVGFVLGYMGGPWISETPEERYGREHRYEQLTKPLPITMM
jgi:hypothetical protein